MKKLIVSTLLLSTLAASSVFADVVQSPKELCFHNDTHGAGNNVQEELSSAGKSGIYSGQVGNEKVACMNPYEWKGAPSSFNVYGVSHNVFGVGYFFQCNFLSLTTVGGVSKASKPRQDYSMWIDSNGNAQCNEIK